MHIERCLLVTIVVFSCIFFTAQCDKQYCKDGGIKCDCIKYRSINGSCNNLEKPYLGMAFRPYARVAPNSYADGEYEFPFNVTSARVVSNAIFPAGDKRSRVYTLALMQTGQFVAHDIALTVDGLDADDPPGCCNSSDRFGPNSGTNKCVDMEYPPQDPDFEESGHECQAFSRAATTKLYNQCPLPKSVEPVTVVTSFLDLSIIYGSDANTTSTLRTLKGGRLNVDKRDGRYWPASPNKTNPTYLVGDVRSNQNPHLTSLHIAFYIEHNRIADGLAKINKHWNDEKLYQESRRINIAQYQHIVYNEILPAFIGKSFMVKNKLLYPKAKNCVDDYDNNVDPSPSVEFSTGAYRFFHSLIAENLVLYNEKRRIVDKIRLTDWMGKPQIQELNSTVNYDTLLRGLVTQPEHESDNIEAHDVKFRLFPGSDGFGFDLISLDIQRGRDHGVAKYLDVRKWCDLPVPSDWDELEEYIPKKHVKKLKKVYSTPKDIELLPGGALEPIMDKTLVGPTFHCVISRQFFNLRAGDRFFYENCESTRFRKNQLNSIRRTSLAKLLCDNSRIKNIQRKVLLLPSDSNPLVPCLKLPGLNLALWKKRNVC